MKEKIFEAFANLGFKLDGSDDTGYVFDYENLHLIYMYNQNLYSLPLKRPLS